MGRVFGYGLAVKKVIDDFDTPRKPKNSFPSGNRVNAEKLEVGIQDVSGFTIDMDAGKPGNPAEQRSGKIGRRRVNRGPFGKDFYGQSRLAVALGINDLTQHPCVWVIHIEKGRKLAVCAPEKILRQALGDGVIIICDVNERTPGLFAHPEPKPRQVLHVLDREIIFDKPGRINPQGGALIALEDLFQSCAPSVIHAEAIEKNREFVGREFPFDKVLEKIDIIWSAEAGHPPEALLEDEGNVKVVAVGLVKEALVIDKEADLGARLAVEAEGE